MSQTLVLRFSAQEVCHTANLSTELLVEIVEHGIVEPEGGSLRDWSFDNSMLSLVQRASRLHRDLEMDWSAIALALNLLEEVSALRRENDMLRQRLERFLAD